MTPDDMIDDKPVTIGDWSPKNSDGRYLGQDHAAPGLSRIEQRRCGAAHPEGRRPAVIQAARDLGISTPIPERSDDRARHLDRLAARTDLRLCVGCQRGYPVRPIGLAEPNAAGLPRLRREHALTRHA
jgi:penicillin-binding protein 1A